MRTIVLFVLMLVVVFVAAAGPASRPGSEPIMQEAMDILSRYGDSTVWDLTIDEMMEMAAAVSVPMQEAAYVRKSQAMSYMVPGSGQFRNGDALSGTLFLAADAAITAGVVVGVYALMPDELKLDYLNTSVSDIKSAWQSYASEVTAADVLPALGVMTGGMILQHGLSVWSSRHAGRLARRNIAEGTVRFEPRPFLVLGPHGAFGLGISMRK